MKTIYINENILKNEEFKKGVLLDTLPSDIVDKIVGNRTSLGNNPSIPDIFDTPFLLKACEQRFNESKNKLKEIGKISDIKETDLHSALSVLLRRCKDIEKPYRNELEKVCVNYLIDLFEVPEETVDVVVRLSDKVDMNIPSINLDPIDGNDEIEFNSVDDALNIKGEIYKRRMLDALCMGGAIRMSDCMEEFSETINKINPKLMDLYSKIIAINDYLLFTKEDIGMSDKNKMQLGTVEVSLGNDNTKAKINSQGVIFPILLSETIRGFLELFISHGLPQNKDIALSVIGKSDFLKAEPWDMKLGPFLWNLLFSSFNDINSKELPYLLKRISSLNVDKFNFLMKEIFAKTKKGKYLMAKLSFKSKKDIEYDKFVDKMTKLKQDKGIITDEFIHPDEL